MDKKEIVKKLIGTYPNSIAVLPIYTNGVGVDFVETVDNFAENIMKDFDAQRQKYYFGLTFESKEDCAKYLAGYLYDLQEACQEFADENFINSEGEVYYDGEEDED